MTSNTTSLAQPVKAPGVQGLFFVASESYPILRGPEALQRTHHVTPQTVRKWHYFQGTDSAV